MTIQIQQTTSEKNRIGKAIRTLYTASGALREETSIINPVIRISGANVPTLKNANYMYIPDFNRYYFITDIKSVRNGLIEISGHVDVLQTYSSQIRSNTAIVKRNANSWNLYIEDGLFKTYANPHIFTKLFPSGFKDPSFVLSVAGGKAVETNTETTDKT